MKSLLDLQGDIAVILATNDHRLKLETAMKWTQEDYKTVYEALDVYRLQLLVQSTYDN